MEPLLRRDEDYIELPAMVGKTIAIAAAGKDKLGYDLLEIVFTDGDKLFVREEGQVGEFSVNFIPLEVIR